MIAYSDQNIIALQFHCLKTCVAYLFPAESKFTDFYYGDKYRNQIICVQVNTNFAIKLVAEEPVTDIGARVVSCDGGGGALGHPKVYINLVRVCRYENSQIITNILFFLIKIQ